MEARVTKLARVSARFPESLTDAGFVAAVPPNEFQPREAPADLVED
jgi:hypothetical protein